MFGDARVMREEKQPVCLRLGEHDAVKRVVVRDGTSETFDCLKHPRASIEYGQLRKDSCLVVVHELRRAPLLYLS